MNDPKWPLHQNLPLMLKFTLESDTQALESSHSEMHSNKLQHHSTHCTDIVDTAAINKTTTAGVWGLVVHLHSLAHQ